MISQPMKGKSTEEIIQERTEVVKKLTELGYKVVNTVFDFDGKNPLCYLAKSIEAMSECDAVYFVPGWTESRGCRVEYTIAIEYDLKILFNGDI